jgi:trehalose synthase-fused probable maltokinase
MDDSLFTTEPGRQRLATEWLPSWLRTRRWFGAKDRVIRECEIVHQVRVGPGWLCAVEVRFEDSAVETYMIPLTCVPSAEAAAVVALINGDFLVDATHVPEFRAALFQVLAGMESVPGVTSDHDDALREMFPEPPASKVLAVEQSNTSLVYEDRLFVKLFRKVEAGLSVDVEMTRFLSRDARFARVPRFFATLAWDGASLALATGFEPESLDGWRLALGYFRLWSSEPTAPSEWKALARKLGERTGEMHATLAQPSDAPDFSPEVIDADRVRAMMIAMLQTARTAAEALGGDTLELTPEAAAVFPEFLKALDGMRPIRRLMDQIEQLPPAGMKTRVHGDFHLGQVLHVDGDFLITDFGGEPLRTLVERRAKQPAVRDVAGMLRSFHYAAHTARGDESPETADARAAEVGNAFLDGWRSKVAGSGSESELMLPIFLIEKAFYELSYEMRHRPEWVHIPLRGLLTLCQALA